MLIGCLPCIGHFWSLGIHGEQGFCDACPPGPYVLVGEEDHNYRNSTRNGWERLGKKQAVPGERG